MKVRSSSCKKGQISTLIYANKKVSIIPWCLFCYATAGTCSNVRLHYKHYPILSLIHIQKNEMYKSAIFYISGLNCLFISMCSILNIINNISRYLMLSYVIYAMLLMLSMLTYIPFFFSENQECFFLICFFNLSNSCFRFQNLKNPRYQFGRPINS